MRIPHLLVTLLPAALLLAAPFAGIARAEDEFVPPPFTVEDIAPSDEERPEGWQPVVKAGVISDTAPTVSGLLDLAAAAKLDTKLISARARSFQMNEHVAGVVVVVGVDAPSPAFTSALADAVVAGKWAVRELGAPGRVAVAWANDKDVAAELLNWQADLAVSKLCKLSYARIEAANKDNFAGDRQGAMAHYQRSIAYAQSAARISPDAGIVNAIRVVLAPPSRRTAALPLMRKALDPKRRIPAPLAWRATIAGQLGLVLLLDGSDEVLEEALRTLKFAVENEGEVKVPEDRFGARYNLACTYARLDRADEAFEALEGSLKVGKEVLGDQYAFHYEHCKDKDPDMEFLREDDRFAALMEKYAPGK